MWFDTHCHLHICEEETPAEVLVAEARATGVTSLVTVGIDAPSSRRSVELARTHDVHAAVGIHPGSSEGWTDDALGAIEDLATDDAVVAVGETGLDFYRDYSPRPDQERAFRAHIELAQRVDKALIIHTRASLDAALDILEEVGPPPRLVFHCWSGDKAGLERALALGAYVSFAGNVSFKSAGDLRAVVPLVPEDRLVIETDSPYLSPVPHRGRPNAPARVIDIGAAVATQLGVAPEAVAEQTSVNARRLFAVA